MRVEDAWPGNIVKVRVLLSTNGMLAGPEHLAKRREGQGKVISVQRVGDNMVVWVKHGDTEAPYWNYELDLIGERT